uniref:Uncharacterized protein n=1 Tax=Timema shepardi TaxID=629360 RepID=A0A7R9AXY4_TIMSH|nr:unnamed protein product [Timema shepardi]
MKLDHVFSQQRKWNEEFRFRLRRSFAKVLRDSICALNFTSPLVCYLSKETVAEIVDLAMLVRKDASVNSVDPLGQGFYRSSPGTSADSASNQYLDYQVENFPRAIEYAGLTDTPTRLGPLAQYPLLDTPAHSPRNTQLSPVIIAIWVTVNSLESSISRILAQN